MTRRNTVCALAGLGLLGSLSAPVPAQAPASDDAIAKIRDEGLNRSHVMDTLSYLCDVIGQRLTASPSMKQANDWTRDTLTSYGLQNAHEEAWGPFGRSWVMKRFSAQVVAPLDFPLIAYPKAWSPGYRGTADVVFLDATDEAGLAKYKGKLKGCIVLPSPMPELNPHFAPRGKRYTDDELTEMENAVPGQRRRRAGGPGGPGGPPGAPGAPRTPGAPGAPGRPGGPGGPGGRFGAAQRFASIRTQFLLDEDVAATVEPSRAGDAGTVFVQSATVANAPDVPFNKRVSPWSLPAPKIIPQVVVAGEQYNRMVRMLKLGAKVRMNIDMSVQFSDKLSTPYNTVAELPGTDLKDQIVMLGGHMNSWHAGTGATDNGAGVAVCMEAMRILKACNLQPRRTIRIALWSGEEEGLFGSRAYVAEHFGSRQGGSASPFGGPGGPGGGTPGTLTTKPEYEKISAYFNLDNGSGKVRGIYCQGNAAVKPLFEQWLAPFKDLGATTTTINNTGSTDHVSFDAIGIPGFQFIQDEIEYETMTHHSNQDVVDHAVAADLEQASVLMAAFVYDAAMRDDMIPRKPQAPPAGGTN